MSKSKFQNLDTVEVNAWLQNQGNHDCFKKNSRTMLNVECINHGERIVIEPGEKFYLPGLWFNKYADGAKAAYSKKRIDLTLKKKVKAPVFKNQSARPDDDE